MWYISLAALARLSHTVCEVLSQDVASGASAGGTTPSGAMAVHFRPRNAADARDSAGMERCQQVVAVLRIVFYFLLRRELGGALVAEELASSLRSEPKPTSSGWMVTFERRSERWHITVSDIVH